MDPDDASRSLPDTHVYLFVREYIPTPYIYYYDDDKDLSLSLIHYLTHRKKLSRAKLKLGSHIRSLTVVLESSLCTHFFHDVGSSGDVRP
jgi:hypothetical protein